ncbi:MAG: deoxyribonuclease IV [Candidatus Micrarchaeota archaeon]|nr:deoxyribonuclease IV [Candidatus Micrarchaeota archaeon]
MLRLGRHISVSGGLDLAFGRAEAIGCTAMQIFVSNPRSWSMHEIDPAEVSKFTGRYEKSSVMDVIAHMPYLPNLSTSDKTIREKSISSLKANLERCEALGIEDIVTHMGSHMGMGVDKALENISSALEEVEDVAPELRILLENEAGHSNSVGADLTEMKIVYDNVKSKRLGFCLDTCHLFAAGYDITDTSALNRIDKEVGFENVHAVHLNDAKMELGSHRDRHDNIGMGHIGLGGFAKFLSFGELKSKILILETAPNDRISEGEEIAAVRNLKIA